MRYANQAAELLLGHSSGGLLDLPLETFDSALGMDAWLARWRAARTGEDDRQCMNASGSAPTASAFRRRSPTASCASAAANTGGLSRRHHERRRASAQLQESEARLKAMAGNVPGLVFRPSATGRRRRYGSPISVKPASARGLPAERLLQLGQGIRSPVHADDEAGYWPASSWRWRKAVTGDGRAHSQSRW